MRSQGERLPFKQAPIIRPEPPLPPVPPIPDDSPGAMLNKPMPPKVFTIRVSDPVLCVFIEDYCNKMQWTKHEFVRNMLYDFFDGLGYGASATRPDLQ